MNRTNEPQCHLRRIGPPSSRPESAEFICFRRSITTIGRSVAQDYILCSRNKVMNSIISRRHARVVIGRNNMHLLHDDSRNGIFVNDLKIPGPVRLDEGDTVTFGHPSGEGLRPRVRVRQPDSEYQYLFEFCSCRRNVAAGNGAATNSGAGVLGAEWNIRSSSIGEGLPSAPMVTTSTPQRTGHGLDHRLNDDGAVDLRTRMETISNTDGERNVVEPRTSEGVREGSINTGQGDNIVHSAEQISIQEIAQEELRNVVVPRTSEAVREGTINTGQGDNIVHSAEQISIQEIAQEALRNVVVPRTSEGARESSINTGQGDDIVHSAEQISIREIAQEELRNVVVPRTSEAVREGTINTGQGDDIVHSAEQISIQEIAQEALRNVVVPRTSEGARESSINTGQGDDIVHSAEQISIREIAQEELRNVVVPRTSEEVRESSINTGQGDDIVHSAEQISIREIAQEELRNIVVPRTSEEVREDSINTGQGDSVMHGAEGISIQEVPHEEERNIVERSTETTESRKVLVGKRLNNLDNENVCVSVSENKVLSRKEDDVEIDTTDREHQLLCPGIQNDVEFALMECEIIEDQIVRKSSFENKIAVPAEIEETREHHLIGHNDQSMPIDKSDTPDDETGESIAKSNPSMPREKSVTPDDERGKSITKCDDSITVERSETPDDETNKSITKCDGSMPIERSETLDGETNESIKKSDDSMTIERSETLNDKTNESIKKSDDSMTIERSEIMDDETNKSIKKSDNSMTIEKNETPDHEINESIKKSDDSMTIERSETLNDKTNESIKKSDDSMTIERSETLDGERNESIKKSDDSMTIERSKTLNDETNESIRKSDDSMTIERSEIMDDETNKSIKKSDDSMTIERNETMDDETNKSIKKSDNSMTIERNETPDHEINESIRKSEDSMTIERSETPDDETNESIKKSDNSMTIERNETPDDEINESIKKSVDSMTIERSETSDDETSKSITKCNDSIAIERSETLDDEPSKSITKCDGERNESIKKSDDSMTIERSETLDDETSKSIMKCNDSMTIERSETLDDETNKSIKKSDDLITLGRSETLDDETNESIKKSVDSMTIERSETPDDETNESIKKSDDSMTIERSKIQDDETSKSIMKCDDSIAIERSETQDDEKNASIEKSDNSMQIEKSETPDDETSKSITKSDNSMPIEKSETLDDSLTLERSETPNDETSKSITKSDESIIRRDIPDDETSKSITKTNDSIALERSLIPDDETNKSIMKSGNSMPIVKSKNPDGKTSKYFTKNDDSMSIERSETPDDEAIKSVMKSDDSITCDRVETDSEGYLIGNSQETLGDEDMSSGDIDGHDSDVTDIGESQDGITKFDEEKTSQAAKSSVTYERLETDSEGCIIGNSQETFGGDDLSSRDLKGQDSDITDIGASQDDIIHDIHDETLSADGSEATVESDATQIEDDVIRVQEESDCHLVLSDATLFDNSLEMTGHLTDVTRLSQTGENDVDMQASQDLFTTRYDSSVASLPSDQELDLTGSERPLMESTPRHPCMDFTTGDIDFKLTGDHPEVIQSALDEHDIDNDDDSVSQGNQTLEGLSEVDSLSNDEREDITVCDLAPVGNKTVNNTDVFSSVEVCDTQTSPHVVELSEEGHVEVTKVISAGTYENSIELFDRDSSSLPGVTDEFQEPAIPTQNESRSEVCDLTAAVNKTANNTDVFSSVQVYDTQTSANEVVELSEEGHVVETKVISAGTYENSIDLFDKDSSSLPAVSDEFKEPALPTQNESRREHTLNKLNRDTEDGTYHSQRENRGNVQDPSCISTFNSDHSIQLTSDSDSDVPASQAMCLMLDNSLDSQESVEYIEVTVIDLQNAEPVIAQSDDKDKEVIDLSHVEDDDDHCIGKTDMMTDASFSDKSGIVERPSAAAQEVIDCDANSSSDEENILSFAEELGVAPLNEAEPTRVHNQGEVKKTSQISTCEEINYDYIEKETDSSDGEEIGSFAEEMGVTPLKKLDDDDDMGVTKTPEMHCGATVSTPKSGSDKQLLFEKLHLISSESKQSCSPVTDFEKVVTNIGSSEGPKQMRKTPTLHTSMSGGDSYLETTVPEYSVSGDIDCKKLKTTVSTTASMKCGQNVDDDEMMCSQMLREPLQTSEMKLACLPSSPDSKAVFLEIDDSSSDNETQDLGHKDLVSSVSIESENPVECSHEVVDCDNRDPGEPLSDLKNRVETDISPSLDIDDLVDERSPIKLIINVASSPKNDVPCNNVIENRESICSDSESMAQECDEHTNGVENQKENSSQSIKPHLHDESVDDMLCSQMLREPLQASYHPTSICTTPLPRSSDVHLEINDLSDGEPQDDDIPPQLAKSDVSENPLSHTAHALSSSEVLQHTIVHQNVDEVSTGKLDSEIKVRDHTQKTNAGEASYAVEISDNDELCDSSLACSSSPKNDVPCNNVIENREGICSDSESFAQDCDKRTDGVENPKENSMQSNKPRLHDESVDDMMCSQMLREPLPASYHPVSICTSPLPRSSDVHLEIDDLSDGEPQDDDIPAQLAKSDVSENPLSHTAHALSSSEVLQHTTVHQNVDKVSTEKLGSEINDTDTQKTDDRDASYAVEISDKDEVCDSPMACQDTRGIGEESQEILNTEDANQVSSQISGTDNVDTNKKIKDTEHFERSMSNTEDVDGFTGRQNKVDGDINDNIKISDIEDIGEITEAEVVVISTETSEDGEDKVEEYTGCVEESQSLLDDEMKHSCETGLDSMADGEEISTNKTPHSLVNLASDDMLCNQMLRRPLPSSPKKSSVSASLLSYSPGVHVELAGLSEDETVEDNSNLTISNTAVDIENQNDEDMYVSVKNPDTAEIDFKIIKTDTVDVNIEIQSTENDTSLKIRKLNDSGNEIKDGGDKIATASDVLQNLPDQQKVLSNETEDKVVQLEEENTSSLSCSLSDSDVKHPNETEKLPVSMFGGDLSADTTRNFDSDDMLCSQMLRQPLPSPKKYLNSAPFLSNYFGVHLELDCLSETKNDNSTPLNPGCSARSNVGDIEISLENENTDDKNAILEETDTLEGEIRCVEKENSSLSQSLLDDDVKHSNEADRLPEGMTDRKEEISTGSAPHSLVNFDSDDMLCSQMLRQPLPSPPKKSLVNAPLLSNSSGVHLKLDALSEDETEQDIPSQLNSLESSCSREHSVTHQKTCTKETNCTDALEDASESTVFSFPEEKVESLLKHLDKEDMFESSLEAIEEVNSKITLKSSEPSQIANKSNEGDHSSTDIVCDNVLKAKQIQATNEKSDRSTCNDTYGFDKEDEMSCSQMLKAPLVPSHDNESESDVQQLPNSSSVHLQMDGSSSEEETQDADHLENCCTVIDDKEDNTCCFIVNEPVPIQSSSGKKRKNSGENYQSCLSEVICKGNKFQKINSDDVFENVKVGNVSESNQTAVSENEDERILDTESEKAKRSHTDTADIPITETVAIIPSHSSFPENADDPTENGPPIKVMKLVSDEKDMKGRMELETVAEGIEVNGNLRKEEEGRETVVADNSLHLREMSTSPDVSLNMDGTHEGKYSAALQRSVALAPIIEISSASTTCMDRYLEGAHHADIGGSVGVDEAVHGHKSMDIKLMNIICNVESSDQQIESERIPSVNKSDTSVASRMTILGCDQAISDRNGDELSNAAENETKNSDENVALIPEVFADMKVSVLDSSKVRASSFAVNDSGPEQAALIQELQLPTMEQHFIVPDINQGVCMNEVNSEKDVNKDDSSADASTEKPHFIHSENKQYNADGDALLKKSDSENKQDTDMKVTNIDASQENLNSEDKPDDNMNVTETETLLVKSHSLVPENKPDDNMNETETEALLVKSHSIVPENKTNDDINGTETETLLVKSHSIVPENKPDDNMNETETEALLVKSHSIVPENKTNDDINGTETETLLVKSHSLVPENRLDDDMNETETEALLVKSHSIVPENKTNDDINGTETETLLVKSHSIVPENKPDDNMNETETEALLVKSHSIVPENKTNDDINGTETETLLVKSHSIIPENKPDDNMNETETEALLVKSHSIVPENKPNDNMNETETETLLVKSHSPVPENKTDDNMNETETETLLVKSHSIVPENKPDDNMNDIDNDALQAILHSSLFENEQDIKVNDGAETALHSKVPVKKQDVDMSQTDANTPQEKAHSTVAVSKEYVDMSRIDANAPQEKEHSTVPVNKQDVDMIRTDANAPQEKEHFTVPVNKQDVDMSQTYANAPQEKEHSTVLVNKQDVDMIQTDANAPQEKEHSTVPLSKQDVDRSQTDANVPHEKGLSTVLEDGCINTTDSGGITNPPIENNEHGLNVAPQKKTSIPMMDFTMYNDTPSAMPKCNQPMIGDQCPESDSSDERHQFSDAESDEGDDSNWSPSHNLSTNVGVMNYPIQNLSFSQPSGVCGKRKSLGTSSVMPSPKRVCDIPGSAAYSRLNPVAGLHRNSLPALVRDRMSGNSSPSSDSDCFRVQSPRSLRSFRPISPQLRSPGSNKLTKCTVNRIEITHSHQNKTSVDLLPAAIQETEQDLKNHQPAELSVMPKEVIQLENKNAEIYSSTSPNLLSMGTPIPDREEKQADSVDDICDSECDTQPQHSDTISEETQLQTSNTSVDSELLDNSVPPLQGEVKKCESSVAGDERESSVEVKEPESSVAGDERKSLVAVEESESSVADKKRESSVAVEESETSVAVQESESLVAVEESESSVADKKRESIVAVEESESSVADKERESSVAVEESESSVPVKEHESSVAVKEHESEVAGNDHESSIAEDEESSVGDERESSVPVEENQSSVAGNELESYVAVNDCESSVADNDHESSVADNDLCGVKRHMTDSCVEVNASISSDIPPVVSISTHNSQPGSSQGQLTDSEKEVYDSPVCDLHNENSEIEFPSSQTSEEFSPSSQNLYDDVETAESEVIKSKSGLKRKASTSPVSEVQRKRSISCQSVENSSSMQDIFADSQEGAASQKSDNCTVSPLEPHSEELPVSDHTSVQDDINATTSLPDTTDTFHDDPSCNLESDNEFLPDVNSTLASPSSDCDAVDNMDSLTEALPIEKQTDTLHSEPISPPSWHSDGVAEPSGYTDNIRADPIGDITVLPSDRWQESSDSEASRLPFLDESLPVLHPFKSKRRKVACSTKTLSTIDAEGGFVPDSQSPSQSPHGLFSPELPTPSQTYKPAASDKAYCKQDTITRNESELSCNFESDDDFSPPEVNMQLLESQESDCDERVPLPSTSRGLLSVRDNDGSSREPLVSTTFQSDEDALYKQETKRRHLAHHSVSSMQDENSDSDRAPLGFLDENLPVLKARSKSRKRKQSPDTCTSSAPEEKSRYRRSSNSKGTSSILQLMKETFLSKNESPEKEVTSSQETPGTSSTFEGSGRKLLLGTPESGTTEDRCGEYVDRGKQIIATLHSILKTKPNLKDQPRVKAWNQELSSLEQKLLLPETVIALVGDTGCGKSSLMNALIGHSDLLPTSGVRACTAVVVEVTNNTTNDKYEAEIEFLSVKEWEEELKIMLNSIKGTNGRISTSARDVQSEAGVALSKIRAVNGSFDDDTTMKELMRPNEVTRWLGGKKNIMDSKPQRFKNRITKYIESTNCASGGEFWPIVKHARLKIPNCHLCKNGAVLVDLPGIRDSNAARDNIAKEFLKKCSAVWIVANIHRAVDDRTASDLLSDHFRRQLLMDGQYGSISFMCTKSEELRPSEIMRDLNLRTRKPEVSILDAKIADMAEHQIERKLNLEHLQDDHKYGRRKMRKISKKRIMLEAGLKAALEDSPDSDEDDGVCSELQEVYKGLVEEEKKLQRNVEDLDLQCRQLESQISEADTMILEQRKAVLSLCAKARNEYAESQIKKVFKSGVKDMKRLAGLNVDDNSGSEDEEEEEHFNNATDNLKVFCLSSLEYMKITKMLPKSDGEPQAFKCANETGIPALKGYVEHLTHKRRVESTNRQLRNLFQITSNIVTYLSDEGTVNEDQRSDTKRMLHHHLKLLSKMYLNPLLERVEEEMDNIFTNVLQTKISEGCLQGKLCANDVVAKWSAPVNRANKFEGGLCWSGFRSVCVGKGSVKSKAYGPRDFNADLSGPMYASISITWIRVFSTQLHNILDNCHSSVMDALQMFMEPMKRDVQDFGIAPERVDRVCKQHLASANTKLTETMDVLKQFINEKQKEVNRLLTPAVQVTVAYRRKYLTKILTQWCYRPDQYRVCPSGCHLSQLWLQQAQIKYTQIYNYLSLTNMLPVYEKCSKESGNGTYERMKAHMNSHVELMKSAMFDNASEELIKHLVILEKEIILQLKKALDATLVDIKVIYEPLWEAPANTRKMRLAFLQELQTALKKCAELMKDANVKDLPHVPKITVGLLNDPTPVKSTINKTVRGRTLRIAKPREMTMKNTDSSELTVERPDMSAPCPPQQQESVSPDTQSQPEKGKFAKLKRRPTGRKSTDTQSARPDLFPPSVLAQLKIKQEPRSPAKRRRMHYYGVIDLTATSSEEEN